MYEERFDRIEPRLDKLETGQNEVRSGQVDLRSGLIDLGRHMRVLHEEVMARLAALPEHAGPTKAEFTEGLTDLREAIGRRLDPLEATVRYHSVEIERLKQARP